MERVIAIYTATRSEYGLLSPVIEAIDDHPHLEYQLIVTGSHLSSAYGNTVAEIEEDGFDIASMFELPEVSIPNTINLCMAKIYEELFKSITFLSPDLFLVLGDRFETFGAAQAAFFANIPIAHIHGGDITYGGCIDDSIRHALTKLAHIHFPVCEESKERILKLGEEPWRVHNCGSPAIDNCNRIDYLDSLDIIDKFNLDPTLPIILFTQHSITTEVNLAAAQVRPALEALKESGYQTIITYPNLDPGGEKIIDVLTEYKTTKNFQIHESLGYKNYLSLMKVCKAVVGNSSSGILETPFFEKPFINIGNRQKGRQQSTNVLNVGYNKDEILRALEIAVHDRIFYETEVENCINPYGDGNAGKKIAEILAHVPMNKSLLQKKITF